MSLPSASKMGQTSSQPEQAEADSEYRQVSEIPGTPLPPTTYGVKKQKRVKSPKLPTFPSAMPGTNRTADPLDSDTSKPAKRKREYETNRRKKSRRKSKPENNMENALADETNPDVSMLIIDEIPPTPSQPTPSKPARAEAKEARKGKKAARLPTTPSNTQSASEHTFPAVSSGIKQASAPVTPNHERSLTPGGRPKSARRSRIREKDSLRIGFYTPEEVEKIEAFKINFCTLHGLSGLKFDEMIQHSDRGDDGDFPVSGNVSTKLDFWNEIYGLVPDRDKRSVYRFMRRHFQVSTQKAHDWSEEQEDELIRLYAQHGPKWTYIGRLLGRSDDDVTQRWKNKLEHKGTMNQGSWGEEETHTFLNAMESSWMSMKPLLGEKAGKNFYDLDERLVVWGNISKAMNHKRTRQQCADKWRKVVKQVKISRANGNPDAEFDVSSAVKTAINWNKRIPANKKSDEYVKDSDDDDDVHDSQKSSIKDNSELAGVLSDKVQAVTSSGPNGVTSETEQVESPKEPKKPKKPKKSKSKRKHAEISPNDHTQLENGTQEEQDSEPELPPPSKQPQQRHTQNEISDVPGELPSSSAISTKTKAERKREKKEKRAKEQQEKTELEAEVKAREDRKAARKEAKRMRKDEKEKKREEEAHVVTNAQSPQFPKKKGKEAATKSKEGRRDKPDSSQRPGESSQAVSSISSNVPAAFISAEAERQNSVSDEEDSSGLEIKPEYDSEEL